MGNFIVRLILVRRGLVWLLLIIQYNFDACRTVAGEGEREVGGVF